MKKETIYPYLNRSLENLPDESWDDVPGFDGDYQISNLGRIKSMRRWRNSGQNSGYYTKEIIIKQHLRISTNRLLNQLIYSVGSSLKKNGISFSTSTARYVYCSFVEPFDLGNKKIMVSYKDYNGRNIQYENLFLSNRTRISKRSHKLQRSKTKFEEYRLPVRQLTIDGKVISTYDSLTEAEKKTGISIGGISSCLNGRIYQFKGFRWDSPAKPQPVQTINDEPKQIFNEYLWKMLGKPQGSRMQPIAALNLSPEDMKGERWMPIEGSEGSYLISNFGRVKGLPRFKKGRLNIWTKGMIKRLIPDGKQHKPTSCLLVQLLGKNGKKFQRSVARLVYYHFIDKIDLEDRKIYIQYKNGKCYDLAPKNLKIIDSTSA